MNPANYQPPAAPGSFLEAWRANEPAAHMAEFGFSGTYTRKAGGSVPLTGNWKAPYSLERLDGMGTPGFESALPGLLFRTADLPNPPPAHGDTWSDGVTTWFVTEVRPNPRQGMTVLLLSLDSPQ